MPKDQWNPGLYDQKHAFVSQYGNDVIDLLAPRRGEVMLDLGCGTGDLTRKIADFDVSVTGIDKSGNMIAEARKKYPAIHFAVEDAMELNHDKAFNAVFSNAALHWMKEPVPVLEGVFRSLKRGGRFVAEFGGKGNVQMITSEVIDQLKKHQVKYTAALFPWYFPSIGEYASLMEAAGFHVTYARHFDRPTPLEGEAGLRNWIEMFGNSIFEQVHDKTRESIIHAVQSRLKKKLYVNNTWIADYKRLRVIGIKV